MTFFNAEKILQGQGQLSSCLALPGQGTSFGWQATNLYIQKKAHRQIFQCTLGKSGAIIDQSAMTAWSFQQNTGIVAPDSSAFSHRWPFSHHPQLLQPAASPVIVNAALDQATLHTSGPDPLKAFHYLSNLQIFAQLSTAPPGGKMNRVLSAQEPVQLHLLSQHLHTHT